MKQTPWHASVNQLLYFISFQILPTNFGPGSVFGTISGNMGAKGVVPCVALKRAKKVMLVSDNYFRRWVTVCRNSPLMVKLLIYRHAAKSLLLPRSLPIGWHPWHTCGLAQLFYSLLPLIHGARLLPFALPFFPISIASIIEIVWKQCFVLSNNAHTTELCDAPFLHSYPRLLLTIGTEISTSLRWHTMYQFTIT